MLSTARDRPAIAPTRYGTSAMSEDAMVCSGCGESVREDQTVLRLTIGTTTEAGTFSGLLLRPDGFLHAGTPSKGPWGDEPNGERWCVTAENVGRALGRMRVDATTGGSGTYAGE
jgi:hypothetical protein